MRVLADRVTLRHRRDHRRAEVLRVRAREADPLDALDRVAGTQELAELHMDFRREISAPGVHVLAQQRDLAHPVACEPRHLGDHLARTAAHFAATHGGNDAVRAFRVAAHGNLHPRLEHAPEGPAPDALAARADPVGEVRDRAGPEGDVDVRVQLEEPLPLRLGVAAADGDHLLGLARLEGRGLREVRGEALVGLLADRARVEDEDVRLVLRHRLAEPERLEHALDPLRVVGVHLAPESRDVIALQGRGNASRISAGRDYHLPSGQWYGCLWSPSGEVSKCRRSVCGCAPRLSLLELLLLLLCAFAVLVAITVASLALAQFVLRKGGTDPQWFWFSGEPPGLQNLREQQREKQRES